MKAIIIVERDAWTWTIREQENCDMGVDLVYEDSAGNISQECLGSLDDAQALVEGLQAYLDFKRMNS